jgi:hypothetical protein
LEWRLANLDLRIQATQAELNRLYERGASQAKKKSAWERLERAVGERDYLLWQCSIRKKTADWELFMRAVNHAFTEFARKVAEAMQPHLAAFSRLSEAAGLSSRRSSGSRERARLRENRALGRCSLRRQCGPGLSGFRSFVRRGR